MNDHEFGHEIRATLQHKGWTQRELARQIPCQRTLVSQWINGVRVPQQQHVSRMTTLFDDVGFTFAVARWATEGQLGVLLGGVHGGRAGAVVFLEREIERLRMALDALAGTLLFAPAKDDTTLVLDVCSRLMGTHVACAELVRRLTWDYEIGARTLYSTFQSEAGVAGYLKTS